MKQNAYSMDTTLFAHVEDTLQLQSDAKNKPAALILLKGEGGDTVFDLLEGETTLGRDWDNTIILQQAKVSRTHCCFTVESNPERVVVTDLGSRNGTFLNQQRLPPDTPTVLKDGDLVDIGKSNAFTYIPKGSYKRLSHDRLQQAANIDALTGCFNKGFLNRRFPQLFYRSIALDQPLSLIIFDLDHFKGLNDTYGHDAGDYVLKELSRLIREEGLRQHPGLFIRFGGEEFTIILQETPLENACTLAESLRALVADHAFNYDGNRLPVFASLGVAERCARTPDHTSLFKLADTALYRSKNEGRNRVTCDDQTQKAE
ncbi:MAG: GGDEF domain-containing protein [Magnetococcales bacterium]|nr:GGDEF domain-containing protein [Magnetococcales bacterium]